MAKLVPENHPVLHQIAEEVAIEDITTPKIQKVIKDMKDVLLKCPRGVAIAAPQIGVSLRIFLVYDNTAEQKEEEKRVPELVVINPKITKVSKKKEEKEEGCLSVPSLYGNTMRHTNVTLQGYDETGQKFERGAGGFLAHIFQHETDHLDGILYTDHAHNTWQTDENYEPIEAEK